MKAPLFNCLRNTRAHGFPHTVTEPTISARIMWLIFSISSCFVFGYHASTLYFVYKAQEVSVSLNPNAIPFIQPDILICLRKPFAIDFLRNPPPVDLPLMTQVANKIANLDQVISNMDPRLIQAVGFDYTLLLWNMLNLTELYQAFFYRPGELFLTVFCNGQATNVPNIEMNWVFLACWRVTPDFCSLLNPWSSLRFIIYIHTYNLNISYSNGFNISLNGTPIEMYKFSETNYYDVTDSVILFFLPRNENILPNSEKVSLIGGTSAEILLSATIFKHQNRSTYNCVNQRTNYTVYDLLVPNKTLTYSDYFTCTMVLTQRKIYTKYNCIVATYPIPIDIPRNTVNCFNNMSNTSLILDFLNQFIGRQYEQSSMAHCNKEVACTTILYQIDTNYMAWPLQAVMVYYMTTQLPAKLKNDLKTGQTNPGILELKNDITGSAVSTRNLWRQNIYNVIIRTGEFNSTQLEESIPYELKNFLADTGGIMGFYIGASLLTLFEVYGIFHHFMFMAFLNWRMKKHTHRFMTPLALVYI